MKITIDGRSLSFDEPCTILEACKKDGIDIPTLCYDARTEPFTSCFLCVVEVEGAKGFVPACATKIREGMAIRTASENIRKARKLCLELLFSDHAGDCVAPCRNNCPAGINIQSYLAYIANKNFAKAIEVIKERNPLPIVCGRVCPKPCEAQCRRALVDEAVAVDNVKRFVADWDIGRDTPYRPQIASERSEKIAIVGAGPAGLSCAYYLRIIGYQVDIYEATNRPGGMLMWGIPEYRLPKQTLLREVETITSMGVKIHYNKCLGKDITIESLRNEYRSVFLAIGAQKSTAIGIKNEELPNVFGGIHFLADVVNGKAPEIGDNVIVIGGGNTAIDAARTSLRLGAKNVYIVYRRTRTEMPAEVFEIEEADHEGVKFNFLRAPLEIIHTNGKITGLKCQVMQLGEPDASGRRKPVPIAGQEELIPATAIIAAIGQYVDVSTLGNKSDLALTKWQTISVNEKNRSFNTSIPGVFAGGDAVTGPSIAISAIAHGMYAAKAIDAYISNKPLARDFRDRFIFTLGNELKRVKKEYVPSAPKIKRSHNRALPISERLNNFNEVEFTFTEEQALNESLRCLSCGCQDHEDCKLRVYAEEYGVNQHLITGEVRQRRIDDSSKYLVFDSTKCIKCGKCIRVCDELKSIGALGFVGRGFATDVLPAFGDKLIHSTCVECGQCEVTCPAGAILDKGITLNRMAQFPTRQESRTCTECSLGCEIEVSYVGDVPVQIHPRYRGTLDEYMLCKLGRYAALSDYQASFAYDTTKYNQLTLGTVKTQAIKQAIESAKHIIIYNVDIFAYYAPVSFFLKQALNQDPALNDKSMNFYFKESGNIYGFARYPVVNKNSLSINCLNAVKSDLAALTTQSTNHKLLIILEEPKLQPDEYTFFQSVKDKSTAVQILSLAKRR